MIADLNHIAYVLLRRFVIAVIACGVAGYVAIVLRALGVV
jgi:hypothetical protein